MKTDELIQTLLAQDGIEKASVEVTVRATVKKQNTGETTERYQPIRERVISEEEIESLVDDTGWHYSGTIDTHGDYRLIDRLNTQYTVENNEN